MQNKLGIWVVIELLYVLLRVYELRHDFMLKIMWRWVDFKMADQGTCYIYAFRYWILVLRGWQTMKWPAMLLQGGTGHLKSCWIGCITIKQVTIYMSLCHCPYRCWSYFKQCFYKSWLILLYFSRVIIKTRAHDNLFLIFSWHLVSWMYNGWITYIEDTISRHRSYPL